MTCGIVPGLIALITSPKATEVPTKGKGYNIFGWIILLVFGIGGLVLNIIDHSTYQNYSGFNSDYINQQFGLRIIITTWIVLIGLYLIELGNGQIVNNNPKYYFHNFKWRSSNFNSYYPSKDFTKRSTSNIEHHLYFIEENNEKVGPFSYDELAQKKVSESTLIWRNGLDNWIPANQLNELSAVVVFNPPPLPQKTDVITSGLDKRTANENIKVQIDNKKNVKKEVVVKESKWVSVEGSKWVSIMLEKYGTQTIDICFDKKQFIKKQILNSIGIALIILIWYFFDPKDMLILIFIPILVSAELLKILETKKLRLVISNSSIQFWKNDELTNEVLVNDFDLTTKSKELTENKVVLNKYGTLLSHREMAYWYIDEVNFVPRRYTFNISENDFFKKEFSREFYDNACEAIAIAYADKKCQ
jgi:hypothetical protein